MIVSDLAALPLCFPIQQHSQHSSFIRPAVATRGAIAETAQAQITMAASW